MPATLARVPQRQYKAAAGAGFNDKQAAKYGKFLERKAGLGKKAVSPEEIVTLAEPEDSPIHEEFTWDDSEAAARYRVTEARHLVNHIVYPADEEGGAELRAFHNVIVTNGETKQGYVSDRVIWQRPELAEQVVERAKRELRGWTDRYAQYEQLSTVRALVVEALEDVAA